MSRLTSRRAVAWAEYCLLTFWKAIMGADVRSAEQGFDEFVGLERLQVLDFFTDADKVHGHGAGAGNCRQHATLGRAVQLGDDEARQLQGIIESLDLRQRVLARVA